MAYESFRERSAGILETKCFKVKDPKLDTKAADEKASGIENGKHYHVSWSETVSQSCQASLLGDRRRRRRACERGSREVDAPDRRWMTSSKTQLLRCALSRLALTRINYFYIRRLPIENARGAPDTWQCDCGNDDRVKSDELLQVRLRGSSNQSAKKTPSQSLSQIASESYGIRRLFWFCVSSSIRISMLGLIMPRNTLM